MDALITLFYEQNIVNAEKINAVIEFEQMKGNGDSKCKFNIYLFIYLFIFFSLNCVKQYYCLDFI